MKIAVAGAGAMGSIFGTRVGGAGNNTDPSSVGPVDVVVFFTKCYHTASAAQLARPLVGPDTMVVSLQNGWETETCSRSSSRPEQIVVGVTCNSAPCSGSGKSPTPEPDGPTMGLFAAESTARAERHARSES